MLTSSRRLAADNTQCVVPPCAAAALREHLGAPHHGSSASHRAREVSRRDHLLAYINADMLGRAMRLAAGFNLRRLLIDVDVDPGAVSAVVHSWIGALMHMLSPMIR